MELVIVRHAESQNNVIKSDNPIPDPELTDLGHEQIRLVAQKLAPERFDRIFSSPMIRTLETANAIAAANPDNPKIEVFFDLREIRGSDDNLCTPGSVLKKRFPLAVFSEDIFNSSEPWVYPGGESRAACQERAKAMLDYIISVSGDKSKLLIVSHVGFIVAMISALFSLTPGAFEFSQANTAVSRVLINPDVTRVVCLNDFSHLL